MVQTAAAPTSKGPRLLGFAASKSGTQTPWMDQIVSGGRSSGS